MFTIKSTIYNFFIMTITVLLCSCDTEPIEENTEYEEWGFRHDRDSSLYVSLGSNSGSYSNTDLYPDFSSVGCIYHEDYTASGVLINEKWVLTAAHNFITDTISPELYPEDLSFRIGSDYNNHVEEVFVVNIFYHPAWIENLYKGDDDGFDIALMELEEPVESVEPATYYIGTNETVGSTIYMSGFGDYEPYFDSGIWSYRRAWVNILDRVVGGLEAENEFEDETFYPYGGLIGFDFDSPNGENNPLDNDNEILGSGNSDPIPLDLEGTIVSGDSGGPCFAKIDGEWVIIGVCSNSDTTSYGAIGIYTRVSSHKDWIYDTMNRNTVSNIVLNP